MIIHLGITKKTPWQKVTIMGHVGFVTRFSITLIIIFITLIINLFQFGLKESRKVKKASWPISATKKA